MTNGEKIKNIYPDLEIISEIKDVYVIILEGHNVWSPKLEVFKSWWNAEYKESSNSEKPNKSEIPTGSEDCISRKAALEMAKSYNTDGWDMYTPLVVDVEDIEELPSATPIRPKGYWIDHSDEGYVECPRCGSATNCDDNINDLHFCFSCGSDMRGEEE